MAPRATLSHEDHNRLQTTFKLREEEDPVKWMGLPQKDQLFILALARLSEPLIQTSLRAYLFYQLRSFNETLPDSEIASQAGIMQASFNAAQLCTAMLWGSFSDRHGRKGVLLIGLLGTAISCVGFGFATTFWQAIIFRVIGGALNGNIGVMRTMVSEIVLEKKYQSRAFLILPMCSNLGVVVGPLLGGLLADPASNYPGIFGGIPWLIKFPYSPPSLLSALFVTSAACAVFFCLHETHEIHRQKEDFGQRCRRKMATVFRQRSSNGTRSHYSQISQEVDPGALPTYLDSFDVTTVSPDYEKGIGSRYKHKLPFRQIFTSNVVCTLVATSLFTSGNGTFNNIFFTFQSTPVYDNKTSSPNYTLHTLLNFTGGLGLPPRDIGITMAILGVVGIILQMVFYPVISARLGSVRTWKMCLYCFPIVYVATPFLALVPSTLPPPSPKSGILIWVYIYGILFVQSMARTFATPAAAILINNCSPHPSVLGTIHGLGQSTSSGARAIGPALGGWLYGVGLNHNIVGAVFWGLAGMAVVNIMASNWITEGDGHEIRLDSDKEAEE